jgi:hypothetical protein
MSDFEDRLRTWGATELAAAGPAPAMRTRRPRRWQPLAAAAAVLILVAAVAVAVNQSGSKRVLPTTSFDVIPWVDTPGTGSTSALGRPTSVPDCVGSDLTLTRGDGDAVFSSRRTNFLSVATTTRCYLSAGVTAATASVDGHRGSVPVRDAGDPQVQPGTIDPDHPGSMSFETDESCLRGEDLSHVLTYSDLRVTLLGTEIPLAPGGLSSAVLSCLGELPVSRAGIGLGGSTSEQNDPLRQVTTTIQAPPAISAGETLHFEVTLTNHLSDDYPLDPCPSYRVQLGHLAESFQLNCKQAHPVPAMGSERFAMELPTWVTDASGSEDLLWTLLEPGLPQVRFPIEVTAPSGSSGHSGCAADTVGEPCASMELGTEYPYSTLTHCGLQSLIADGRTWRLSKGLSDDGNGNPPPGYTDVSDDGFIRLASEDLLRARSSQGVLTEWKPGESLDGPCG